MTVSPEPGWKSKSEVEKIDCLRDEGHKHILLVMVNDL
jgi:hypothetical protein